jgi:hypothetical protein
MKLGGLLRYRTVLTRFTDGGGNLSTKGRIEMLNLKTKLSTAISIRSLADITQVILPLTSSSCKSVTNRIYITYGLNAHIDKTGTPYGIRTHTPSV